MSISLDIIKKLREKTGAGMVDCKKSLEESNGDIDKAIETLRKKGIAKAQKRGDRDTSEGVIKVGINDENNKACILQLNSETDFVAKNSQFQDFAEEVLNLMKNENFNSLDELLSFQFRNSTVKEELENLSGVIGEKLEIKKIDTLEGKSLAAYSHMGGKIGVLIALNKDGENELSSNLAMQVAAVNPKYLNSSDVPQEEIDKEKEIEREKLKKENKPEQIIDKILDGKIRKYCEEVCLVEQDYIKDDKKKIKEILGDAEIVKFIRYSLS